jgi:hypothetical protein
MHLKVYRGYGGAIKAGIIAATTAYVITIDANGQFRLDDVTTLYEVLCKQDADMVIGSRQKLVESLYRKSGKALIRSFAALLMPLPLQDLNSGMKIYSTDLARQYLQLCPDTKAYSDVITLVFVNHRNLVLEQPVTVAPPATGKPTISYKNAIDTVLEILNIATIFDPMRLFLPLAMFFLLFSTVWGIPIFLQGQGVSVGTLFLFVTGLIFFFLGLIAEQLALIRKSISLPCLKPPAKD